MKLYGNDAIPFFIQTDLHGRSNDPARWLTNNFGNTSAVKTGDLGHYVVYDSLYCHDAYGAIVSFTILTVAAILFAVGTNREMAGGDNRSAQE